MGLMLWLFLLFTSLYHVLVTVFVYGLGRSHPETLVVLRDGLWIVFFGISLIAYRKHIAAYIRSTWYLRVVFIVLCLVGFLVSYVHGKTISDMVVGAKYGLQFFVIFLSAIFIGQVFASMHKEKFQRVLRRLFYLLCGIIIVGLVRQIAKMIWPDAFYAIGYAPFGDRVFGHNPPLYYLTGPGGYPRLSGIFSGPNNYGYLFVGMFGFVWWYIRTYVKNKTMKICLWIVITLSILLTLSRGAILGIFLQLVILSFIVFHKKRRYVVSIIAVGLLIVGALSVLKRGSTLAHVRAKFGSLSYVIENPLGYGLGSSGPSIHTGHGTILPENFFIQVLIDIGIPGLILRLSFWYLVLRNIRIYRAESREQRVESLGPMTYDLSMNTLLMCLSFSFLGLLLEGMFLHVFEDSMVNYRFFMLWGIVYGYCISNLSAKKPLQ